jgi:hypothetical protein
MQFAHRWMNCLLVREFPLPLAVRLWDAYVAECRGAGRSKFGELHVFVCAALLLRFADDIRGKPLEEWLPFVQNLTPLFPAHHLTQDTMQGLHIRPRQRQTAPRRAAA